MALADLELNLEVAVTNSCGTLELKDKVGSYIDVTNINGWGGATANPSDIDSAILEITDPSGTVTTTDITALVKALTISGDDSFGSYAIYTVDGEYEINLR